MLGVALDHHRAQDTMQFVTLLKPAAYYRSEQAFINEFCYCLAYKYPTIIGIHRFKFSP